MFLDVPAGNRRAKRWSARGPRRAAQGICDFQELPALARVFSLRGLPDSAWWNHWGPAGMCKDCVHDMGKNSRKRVICHMTAGCVHSAAPLQHCKRGIQRRRERGDGFTKHVTAHIISLKACYSERFCWSFLYNLPVDQPACPEGLLVLELWSMW